ncbi:MAG: hypothetical protein JST55_05895 [Bacteroidetes bacterium]|nr:hypothetical protein [Bacteroidota bacterium]
MNFQQIIFNFVKQKFIISLVIIFVALIFQTSFAQQQNDYATISSGNWSNPGIWQMFDTTTHTWKNVASAPSASGNVITIAFAHTVAYDIAASMDQLVVNGTLTLNSGIPLNLSDGPGDDLKILGTVNGAADINIFSGASMDFQGGTVSGTGLITVAAGGTLKFTTNSINLNRTVNNSGTISWTGGTVQGTGAINNNNVFNDQCSFGAAFYPTVTNNSTFTKSTNNQNIFFGAFINSGTMNITSGNVTLGQASGSSTLGGTITVSSGGTLQLGQASSTAFTVNASISGAGTVLGFSTTVNFSTSCIYNITGVTNAATGTMTFTPGMTLINIGNLSPSGGTINLPSGLLIGGVGTNITFTGGGQLNLNTGQTFNFQKITFTGGTLTGSDSVTVSDSLIFSTGVMSGTGVITLKSGGICTIFNNGGNIDKPFINNGTINWTANSLFGTGNIYNNSVINMTNTANSSYVGIINSGTVNKSSPNLTQWIGNFTNNPGSIINITSGSILASINSGTYSVAGTINLSSGTNMQLGNSSNATFNVTANINGAGGFSGSSSNINFLAGAVYNITGATTGNYGSITFNSAMTMVNIGSLATIGGTINLQPGLVIPSIGSSLSLTGGGQINFNSGQTFQFTSVTCSGTLNGSDTIKVNGSMVCSGGTLSGTGPVNILSGSTMDINNNGVVITKTVNNSGTLTWTQTGIVGGGVINNNNIFNISTGANYTCNPLINNFGTVNKGTNTNPNLAGGMNNSGTVNITAGTLFLSPNAGAFTQSGIYNVASSCVLSMGQNGGNLTESVSGTITGAGKVVLGMSTINFTSSSVYNISGTTTASTGTVNLNSSMTLTNLGTLVVSGATVNFPAGILIGAMSSNLVISSGLVNFNTGRSRTFNQLDLGGSIGGTDTTYISSAFNWTNNAINSPAIVVVKNGGTGTINLNGVTLGGTLINNGTINWTQNSISGTGTIYNNNIFNINAVAAHSIICPLVNNGTLNKTTAGFNSIAGSFINNSVMNINLGGINIVSGSNFGTINIAPGTTLSENNGTYVSYGTINLPATGILTGNGALTVNSPAFVVDGTISISTLQFDSVTTLSGSGTVNTTTSFLNGCNVSLGSNLQFKNINILSGGNFILNGYKALVNGTGTVISNSGTLNTNNSTIEYNGSNAQLISNSNIVYKNLFINNSAGTSFTSGTTTVNDTLKIISGFLNVVNNSVSLGSTGYLVESPGATVRGTTGNITTTRTITSPNNLNVAGLGATITSTADLGNTTITRGFTNYSINGSGTVLRYYNISPANNTGLNATLTYHYDNYELNGLNKNLLSLFRSTNAGTNWAINGGAKDTANNNIIQQGINAFSYWTAGINPLASSINITAIIDGIYNTSTNTLNKRDTVTVYLRNSSAPYAILDSSKIILDTVTFSATAFFNTTPTGTYYLSLKYRNALETWTKSGGENYTAGSSMSYDFTTAQSQSYSNSTILKNGKYCIISGDLNQDGFVNGNDFTSFSQQFGQTGYLRADLNGDNIVNGNDFTTFSASFGKQSSHP